MYETFYGLNEIPFSVTPDTRYFFPSEKHDEALKSLIYAIQERKGFVVITGEIGSGKTTVWHSLIPKIDIGTKFALITNTYLTPKQMLMAILDEFEINFKETWPKIKLLQYLNKYLLEQVHLGFNVVILIDEAQNLTPSVLEEVRMLSNLETEREKLLQIILMGQPELKDMLARKELIQLRQRISVYYHIFPLSEEETNRYIEHRLKIAGFNGGGVLFEPPALNKIYTYSEGTPRLINSLCDRALLTGFIRERRTIDKDIIEEAARDLKIGGLPN